MLNRFLYVFAGVCGVLVLLSVLTWLLWNWLMPVIFDLPEITLLQTLGLVTLILQAIGLVTLTSILFRSSPN